MKNLVRLLQNAHSGEIAAFHAYEGHWRSVRDTSERIAIQLIQLDELRHRIEIYKFLTILAARPNKYQDFLFFLIGKFLSGLCYCTGWLAPMWGALLIEQLGVVNYAELSIEANKEGFPTMAERLLDMGQKEREHEQYFLGKLKERKARNENH